MCNIRVTILLASFFYRYNIQCPSEHFDLHYLMVEFSLEPPDETGQCLDFLRTLIVLAKLYTVI